MKRKPLRVGLIGYGLVGQDVARLLKEHAADTIAVVGALVRSPAQICPPGPAIVTTCDELLTKRPDIIVEAAGHTAIREHGEAVLRAGIDFIIISIGALATPQVLHGLLEAAEMGDAHLKIASGAIGGLDALAAASLGGLTSVMHTMRKPPLSLLPPEEATQLKNAREIFQGSARQAAQRFPEFLNVAAAVALAGNGFDHTIVRVIADPMTEHSVHEVQATGTIGTFRFEIQNNPLQPSARGARLVAMSIVHILLQQGASFTIG